MDKSFWSFSRRGGTELPWPVDETGQKEKAVLLQSALDNLADADMTISMLAAYDIPCFKHYAKEGAAGKVINGFSGFGAELYVPASQAEEAMALLSADICQEEKEEE